MNVETHLPVTCQVYAEEREIVGVGGCNVRVRVLSDDSVLARIRVDDCGVVVRQGDIHTVNSSALNGGRR